MPKLVNPFTSPGKWYKANLHTHTTLSDGPLTPVERVEQYRKGGYSVLALTDHRKMNDARGLGGRGILVLGGMEYHPVCEEPPGWFHFVALGVPPDFKVKDGSRHANRAIATVARAGGISILAHPAWCGQSFADFRHLKGIVAIEVYNSTCDRAGRASSENEWADALDHGWQLPAVGSDDCHRAYDEDVLECWTWLRMPALTERNVLRAIVTGSCYASCGPRVHDFRIADGKVRLRCSAAAKITFAGGTGQGRRQRAGEGKSVTRFAIDVPKWPYVRAVVTDARGRTAWTNPIFLNR